VRTRLVEMVESVPQRRSERFHAIPSRKSLQIGPEGS
jgi:hypothetical protein